MEDYTIQNANEWMTIFFWNDPESPEAYGEIKDPTYGKQNMHYYGILENSYAKILDYIQIPFDENVMKSPENFRVENKQLTIKPTAIRTTYKVARY